MSKGFKFYNVGCGLVPINEVLKEAKKNGFKFYYWASEYGYEGFYNGDTVVIYNDINDLNGKYKKDALKYGKEINNDSLKHFEYNC